jgi:hypothetical protein
LIILILTLFTLFALSAPVVGVGGASAYWCNGTNDPC